MRKFASLFAAALAFGASPATSAVTLQVNDSGQLIGATGISVRDARFDGVVSYSTYDVSFEEGTCSALFSGCDESSDFVLTGGGTALAAQYGAEALLDQVFTGAFDTSPALTYGCGAPTFCQVIIPYEVYLGTMFAVVAFNSTTDDGDGSTIGAYGPDFDTTNGPVVFANNTVYARFSLSAAAVPEPGTWGMMLLGFGVIGMALRRKRPAFASQA